MPTPKKVKMPSATSIVARSFPDFIIGVENALPWHLRTDLQHFKKRTAGHAVIMGRRTFESLGKPLPNRLNIVLTRSEFADYDNVRWARDPETALWLADIHSIFNLQREFFVIGGEVIFEELKKYINEFWLTDVYTGPMNGDAKFDYQFLPGEWRTKAEEEYKAGDHDQFAFRISHFVRKKRVHREKSKEEFMPHAPTIYAKFDEWAAMVEAERDDPDLDGDQVKLV